MEKSASYLVKITPEAEQHYLHLLSHLYHTHNEKSAAKKSEDILSLAMSLDENPHRGRTEEGLSYLGKEHQFLVYQILKRKTVKIIYFVEEETKHVYITDFFPTEMHPSKLKGRS